MSAHTHEYMRKNEELSSAPLSLQSNFVRLANNGISFYEHNRMHVGQNRTCREPPMRRTKRSVLRTVLFFEFTCRCDLKKKKINK